MWITKTHDGLCLGSVPSIQPCFWSHFVKTIFHLSLLYLFLYTNNTKNQFPVNTSYCRWKPVMLLFVFNLTSSGQCKKQRTMKVTQTEWQGGGGVADGKTVLAKVIWRNHVRLTGHKRKLIESMWDALGPAPPMLEKLKEENWHTQITYRRMTREL
jgi:hypothetical protein